MSRLVIIPARGGSKRIIKKNIINFCGKPIIYYSLKLAYDSKLFDEIHISTEDATIVEVVEKLSFNIPFLRPRSLSGDQTPIIPVLRWVLQEFQRRGKVFRDVCSLFPCAPLISINDLVKGYNSFDKNGGKIPVMAVGKFPVPIEWALDMDEGGLLKERNPNMFKVRSQEIKPSYFDSGTFVIFPSELLLDETYEGGGEMEGLVLPVERSVDIDELEDLKLAEVIYRGLQR